MASGVPDTKPLVLGPWQGHDDNAVAGTPYVRNSLNVVFEPDHDGGPPLVRRRLGRIRVVSAMSNPVRRVANLMVYVSGHGARELIAWLDPATDANTDALLLRQDGMNLIGTALAMPAEMLVQRRGGDIPFVQFYGNLIFLDSFGRPLVYDGRTVLPLRAMQGTHAKQTGERFMPTPPSGQFLLVWRNRLVIAGGEATPRTIGLSESNGSPEVPYSAPVGGPNVWPFATNFDVQTDEGDKITGAVLLNDRLVVATRRTVTIVDEDTVAPIARTKSRHAGCVAPRTFLSIGNHVIFVGDRAIFSFDGEALEPISGPVERILREWVNWNAIEGAIAVNWTSKREYRVWLPVVGDGDNKNRLCLVWNYRKKTWRVASGWYLFDRSSRRGNAMHFDVTCATAHLLSDADEVLLTGNSESGIIMEDVGGFDHLGGVNTSVFPAYIELPEVELGAMVETYRDVRVDCVHDGAPMEALAVMDGRNVEQEIVRVLDGGLTEDPTTDDIPYIKEIALKDGQQTWASVARWPIDVIGPVRDELKMGLAQRGRSVRLAVLLPGAQDQVRDTAPGGIHQVEITLRGREGRR